jgi:hypothetical protein
LQSVKLQTLDVLVNSGVINSFTNVPIEETLNFFRNELHEDEILAYPSVFQVEVGAGKWRTKYFQVDNEFFQQREDMAAGSSLSSIVSNKFLENFEKLALNSS